MRDVVDSELGALRRELLPRRLRAELGGSTVVDTNRGMLVWEPRRVVPRLRGAGRGHRRHGRRPTRTASFTPPESPMIFPNTPFAAHTTPGEPVLVSVGDRTAKGFKPADAGLDGYVELDFGDFDAWYEEDERSIGHPRDPYHRIDVLPSLAAHPDRARRGRAGRDRPAEAAVRDRPADPLLPAGRGRRGCRCGTARCGPSARTRARRRTSRSRCRTGPCSTTWSGTTRSRSTTPSPVRDLVAFYDEKVDVVIDGVRHGRPRTEWS